MNPPLWLLIVRTESALALYIWCGFIKEDHR